MFESLLQYWYILLAAGVIVLVVAAYAIFKARQSKGVSKRGQVRVAILSQNKLAKLFVNRDEIENYSSIRPRDFEGKSYLFLEEIPRTEPLQVSATEKDNGDDKGNGQGDNASLLATLGQKPNKEPIAKEPQKRRGRKAKHATAKQA